MKNQAECDELERELERLDALVQRLKRALAEERAREPEGQSSAELDEL